MDNKEESLAELIERLEKECGCRIDDNDGDNLAMAGLFGAIARMMGKTPPMYKPRDDVAAGLLIRHQMSSEYAQEKRQEELIAQMLMAGFSPDDLKELF